MCICVSLSVVILDHSAQHILSFPRWSVDASVAVTGNVTHALFSLGHNLQPEIQQSQNSHYSLPVVR